LGEEVVTSHNRFGQSWAATKPVAITSTAFASARFVSEASSAAKLRA
jgi:hypothetical protein